MSDFSSASLCFFLSRSLPLSLSVPLSLPLSLSLSLFLSAISLSLFSLTPHSMNARCCYCSRLPLLRPDVPRPPGTTCVCVRSSSPSRSELHVECTLHAEWADVDRKYRCRCGEISVKCTPDSNFLTITKPVGSTSSSSSSSSLLLLLLLLLLPSLRSPFPRVRPLSCVSVPLPFATVVLCCAVLCCVVLCCAVLCCAVLCCAVLCVEVLCCALLPFCICQGDLALCDAEQPVPPQANPPCLRGVGT